MDGASWADEQTSVSLGDDAKRALLLSGAAGWRMHRTVPTTDARDADNDAAVVDGVEDDAPEFDAAVNDVPDPPVYVPNRTDVPHRDVPNWDVPNFDVPNRDVPNPRPCQLDPFNCGMCGRVCGRGRPLCAETLPGQWGCVNNGGRFVPGCLYPDRESMCCPGVVCGPDGIGCR